MKTKKDFIEALVGLGHDRADLEAMGLPALKSLYEEATDTATAAPTSAKAEEVDETEDEGGEKEVCIYKRGNNRNIFVRTYSLKVHGKGFKELAKQFTDKFPNSFAAPRE